MTGPNTSIALASSLCSYMRSQCGNSRSALQWLSHFLSLQKRPYASLGLVLLIVLRGWSHFLVEIAHPGGESLGHRGPSIGRGVWPGVGHTVILSKGLMTEVTFCGRTVTVSEVRAFGSTAWSGLHPVEEAHPQSLGCVEWTFHREKVLLRCERSFCVSYFSTPLVERGAGLASGSAGCSQLFVMRMELNLNSTHCISPLQNTSAPNY